MRCPDCNSRLIPHTNLDEQTIWICPVDSCGTAVFFPLADPLDEIREYWLCRSQLAESSNVVPFRKVGA